MDGQGARGGLEAKLKIDKFRLLNLGTLSGFELGLLSGTAVPRASP
eukprot:SAG31_NODE_33626_length_341_cov_1.892562_1_plen_45_part_10